MNSRIQYSILAIAGPVVELNEIKKNGQLKKMFDKIHYFDIPDDYGEFPDTTGYTSKNWETMESTMEDGNLYSFMQKCMDCISDFVINRGNFLENAGYWNIEDTIQWPKFGGKVFAIAGFITANKPNTGGAIKISLN